MAVCGQGRDDGTQLSINIRNPIPTTFFKSSTKINTCIIILLTINSVGVKVYIIMVYTLQ